MLQVVVVEEEEEMAVDSGFCLARRINLFRAHRNVCLGGKWDVASGISMKGVARDMETCVVEVTVPFACMRLRRRRRGRTKKGRGDGRTDFWRLL